MTTISFCAVMLSSFLAGIPIGMLMMVCCLDRRAKGVK